ncbi:MAG: glucoamylase family protein [Parvibaculaceae bacterium]
MSLPRLTVDNTPEESDEALLDRFQRAAFGYFLENCNPENGLVADTSREGAPASIAVVGFALSCYPVGAERGWMTRADAAARSLVTLQFFLNSLQSAEPNSTGYKGFYYHFLDMKTGERVWSSELSLIDTTLLLAGVLTASVYFDKDTPDENEIRKIADTFYRRIDWQWSLGGEATTRQGWKPEHGFLHYGWDGYDEALVLYVLGLASPTTPLPKDSYEEWTATYQWENIYDTELLYAGPLFIHHYSQTWINFSGIRDAFMREKDSDYFENSQRATYVQREYARRNPHSFKGYGKDLWGITANDGPGYQKLEIDGRERRFFGYAARGVPYGPDDGTIDPCATLASLPFTPELSISALRHLCKNYPDMISNSRLPSAFNPTFPGKGPSGWISEGYFGLDQGIIVLMIENYRSGLIWKLMQRCPYIVSGLRQAGFSGGWLT